MCRQLELPGAPGALSFLHSNLGTGEAAAECVPALDVTRVYYKHGLCINRTHHSQADRAQIPARGS